jgi:hypothetical protein
VVYVFGNTYFVAGHGYDVFFVGLSIDTCIRCWVFPRYHNCTCGREKNDCDKQMLAELGQVALGNGLIDYSKPDEPKYGVYAHQIQTDTSQTLYRVKFTVRINHGSFQSLKMIFLMTKMNTNPNPRRGSRPCSNTTSTCM